MGNLKCKCCVQLTINPWAKLLADRATRIVASACPLHGNGPIRWKRSTVDYVESHNGLWWITPIYGGLTRPESYELRFKGAPTNKQIDGWRVVGSGSTQRECKEVAEMICERTHS